MKKLVIGLLIGFTIGLASNAYASIGNTVSAVFADFNYVVNGTGKTIDAPVLVYDGASYMRTTQIANMLGFDVTYKSDSRTIEFNKPDVTSTPSPNGNDKSTPKPTFTPSPSGGSIGVNPSPTPLGSSNGVVTGDQTASPSPTDSVTPTPSPTPSSSESPSPTPIVTPSPTPAPQGMSNERMAYCDNLKHLDYDTYLQECVYRVP